MNKIFYLLDFIVSKISKTIEKIFGVTLDETGKGIVTIIFIIIFVLIIWYIIHFFFPDSKDDRK